MRGWLIVIVTFLSGVYFFVEFFLPSHVIVRGTDFQMGRYDEKIQNVVRVIFYMSLALGVINLLRVHGYTLVRKRKGAVNSAALIVAMFVTVVAGFWGEFGTSDGAKSFFWDFLFGGIMNNLGAAMFSLLAFYIASAAYRAFRVHNPEAALLMLAALVVMIGQIPLGFYVSEHFPTVRDWLMTRVNTPAFRGIFFGAAIAGLAMAVRMWWSLEKGSASPGIGGR